MTLAGEPVSIVTLDAESVRPIGPGKSPTPERSHKCLTL
jgi:hypothetical protein